MLLPIDYNFSRPHASIGFVPTAEYNTNLIILKKNLILLNVTDFRGDDTNPILHGTTSKFFTHLLVFFLRPARALPTEEIEDLQSA